MRAWILTLLVATAPAFAATGDAAKSAAEAAGTRLVKMNNTSCAALRDQYQDARMQAERQKRFAAGYYANEGRSFCLTGYPQEGAEAYRRALRILGTQPAN